jgi:hypothetical protein
MYTFSTYRNKLTNFFKGTGEPPTFATHWDSATTLKSLTSLISMTFIYFFNVRYASLSAGTPLSSQSRLFPWHLYINFLTSGMHRYRPEISVKSVMSLSMTFIYIFNVRYASLSAKNLCQVSRVSFHDIFIYFFNVRYASLSAGNLCLVTHVSIHDIYIFF